MAAPFNRIVITGARGWLGKRLTSLIARRPPDIEVLRELPAGLPIRALVLPGEDATELLSLGVEVVEGDLRSPAACARLCEDAKGAVLFHTAGVIHPKNVKQFYDINVRGVQNLLDAAVAAGVKRAVIVSSNSPLGVNPHRDHLFDELSPYRPYMNYGKSKMLMELAVKEAEAAGRIETVIVRPPWFYGVDQPPRQTLFFSMIRAGKAPIVGSGGNLRSMAYIDNLCEGLLLAALVDRARGGIYWIADRRPYSMNEIVDTIERLLEEEFGMTVAHKRMRLPGIAGEIATVADGTLQALGVYHQKIHVLSEMNKTIACSIAKAETELGYKPKVALEEGMRRSLEFCIRNGARI